MIAFGTYYSFRLYIAVIENNFFLTVPTLPNIIVYGLDLLFYTLTLGKVLVILFFTEPKHAVLTRCAGRRRIP